MAIKKEHFAPIFGGMTLILFASKPYILELIEPSKSVGQLIGENAKDIIDAFNGEKQTSLNSARDNWRIGLNILAITFFAITVILSIPLLRKKSSRMYGLVSIALAVTGLGIFLAYLTIGFIVLLVIGAMAIAFLVFIESS